MVARDANVLLDSLRQQMQTLRIPHALLVPPEACPPSATKRARSAPLEVRQMRYKALASCVMQARFRVKVQVLAHPALLGPHQMKALPHAQHTLSPTSSSKAQQSATSIERR